MNRIFFKESQKKSALIIKRCWKLEVGSGVVVIFFSFFHFCVHHRLPERMSKNIEGNHYDDDEDDDSDKTMIMTKTKPEGHERQAVCCHSICFFPTFSLFKNAKTVRCFRCDHFDWKEQEQRKYAYAQCHTPPLTMKTYEFLKIVGCFWLFEFAIKTWKMTESIFLDGVVCMAFDCFSWLNC